MALATATVLTIAAVTDTAATTTYSVHSSNMAIKSANTAAGQQAVAETAQLEMQNAAEQSQASADEVDRQRTLQRILAAQTAVFGSSGAEGGSGSFLGIQTADSSRANEATRLNQMFTDTRQVGFQNNIKNIAAQTQIDRNAGEMARRTNTIKGGLSVISNAASGYYMSTIKK